MVDIENFSNKSVQSNESTIYKNFYLSFILITLHTTYRKNNNLEKCAGMGLNGFQIRLTFGTQDNWKNENPGSRFGATS